jgi:hypothetical protein
MRLEQLAHTFAKVDFSIGYRTDYIGQGQVGRPIVFEDVATGPGIQQFLNEGLSMDHGYDEDIQAGIFIQQFWNQVKNGIRIGVGGVGGYVDIQQQNIHRVGGQQGFNLAPKASRPYDLNFILAFQAGGITIHHAGVVIDDGDMYDWSGTVIHDADRIALLGRLDKFFDGKPLQLSIRRRRHRTKPMDAGVQNYYHR